MTNARVLGGCILAIIIWNLCAVSVASTSIGLDQGFNIWALLTNPGMLSISAIVNTVLVVIAIKSAATLS